VLGVALTPRLNPTTAETGWCLRGRPSTFRHPVDCRHSIVQSGRCCWVTGTDLPNGVDGTANRGTVCANGRARVLPVLLDCSYPSGRGRLVKAREAAACGILLPRRVWPRESINKKDVSSNQQIDTLAKVVISKSLAPSVVTWLK
jgi:hypothetical protein